MAKSNGLSKKVTELLKNASVRQKAKLYCSDWRDRNNLQQKTLITEQEAKEIERSLTTNEEKKEFNHYVHLYNVYARMAPIFGLSEALYKQRANLIVGYLRQVEAYTNEENHLNTIYQNLQDNGNAEAIKCFEDSLNYLSFPWADIKRDEDGYIEIDCTQLWDRIIEAIKDCNVSFYAYKSIILAVEEWTKKKRASAFMPQIIKDSIAEAKEDYALEVAPQYSRKELKRKIDSGMRVTPSERKKAIFPYYEEIEPSEQEIDMWRTKIQNVDKYED